MQIPFDYSVNVGLDFLDITHGYFLFDGFFFISAFGSVTLPSSHSYGGAQVSQTTPVGVSVALNGSPLVGETWTLTLDGVPYATAVVAGDSLASVASRIAALIPTNPTAAQGGPFYAVSITGGTTITVRRVDATIPVTASVTVSNPGSASTTTSGNTVDVTYAGTPLDNEIWTITVDGMTYTYISRRHGPALTTSLRRSRR